jgi:hypothetical protein
VSAGYLSAALRDARSIEFRHLGEWPSSGQFDSLWDLEQAIGKFSHAGNCYTTLNRPTPKAENRMAGGRKYALHDADISHIVRIPFDFDPVRPAGTASTDAEMLLAIERRDRLVTFLSGQGWPMPALGSSGNGAHALYRCVLPNDGDTAGLFDLIYLGLEKLFSDSLVQFDRSVKNPSRIWRLYGTINRKGEPTEERPHRMATVWLPPRWEGVSPDQIKRLAGSFVEVKKAKVIERRAINRQIAAGKGDYETLDIVGWFQSHGLYRGHLRDDKHAVECPWNSEHTTYGYDSTVIWEGTGGKPTFHCSHSHCVDTRGLWEVIAHLGDADQFCAREWQKEKPAC